MKDNKNILTAYGNAFVKYFTFSGRSSRYDFWAYRLVDILIIIALSIITALWQSLSLINGIYVLLTLIPGLALLSRRMHDVGKSFWLVGLWILLPLVVMLINGIISYSLGEGNRLSSILMILLFIVMLILSFYILYLVCQKGNDKANKYGKRLTENAKYVSTGKWLIIAYFGIIIVASVISVGFISLYSKATFVSKVDQTAAQVDLLQANIHSLFANSSDGYQSLSDILLVRTGNVPEDMIGENSLVNPFGGMVFVAPTMTGFGIVYTDIPVKACERLSAENYGSNLVSLELERGQIDNCQACPPRGCEMAWIFK